MVWNLFAKGDKELSPLSAAKRRGCISGQVHLLQSTRRPQFCYPNDCAFSYYQKQYFHLVTHFCRYRMFTQTIHTYPGNQLVQRNFPQTGIATSRAQLSGSDALVRRPVIQCVRPDRRIWEGRNHRRIVNKTKLRHHQKLTVPADPKKRYSQALRRYKKILAYNHFKYSQ